MKLVLGTVQFGLKYGATNTTGQVSQDDAFKILDFAWDAGIDTLDTAIDYGNALMVIGNYHKARNHRFKIYSKFIRNSGKSIQDLLQINLNTLGVETLEGLYFHKFTDVAMTTKDELDELFLINKKITRFKNFGASVYDLEEAVQLSRAQQFNLIQLPYNLLDSSIEKRNTIKQLKSQGFEVHTRSTFLQGLLMSSQLHSKWSRLEQFHSHLHELASNNNMPVGELALRYAISNNSIGSIVIGVDSVEQLKLNLDWYRKGALESSFLHSIESLSQPQLEWVDPRKW